MSKSEEAAYHLAALVTSSDDAIIGKTAKGIITSWNQGAEHLFGWSAKEAIGKSIFIIVPASRHTEEDEILRKINRGERIQHYRTDRQKKDGVIVPVSVTISPIVDKVGKV